MVNLVHITADNQANRIRRNGIATTPISRSPGDPAPFDDVVYAFPVLPSYVLTHAWARELKRFGRTSLVAVTFSIDDAEPVLVGRYNLGHRLVSAAEAVGLVRAEPDPRGFEVLVPHRIAPGAIRRVANLPRAVGWRYWPGARGAPMRLCDCPACQPRGEVKARRYRRAVADRLAAKP